MARHTPGRRGVGRGEPAGHLDQGVDRVALVDRAAPADTVQAQDQTAIRRPLEPEIGGAVGEDRGRPGVHGKAHFGGRGGQVDRARAALLRSGQHQIS